MLGFTDVPSQVTINGQIKKIYAKNYIHSSPCESKNKNRYNSVYPVCALQKKKKREREKQPYACFLDGNLTDRLSCCNSHFPFSKLKRHMKLVWHNFTHMLL